MLSTQKDISTLDASKFAGMGQVYNYIIVHNRYCACG